MSERFPFTAYELFRCRERWDAALPTPVSCTLKLIEEWQEARENRTYLPRPDRTETPTPGDSDAS